MLAEASVASLGELELTTLKEHVQRNIMCGMRAEPPAQSIFDPHCSSLQRQQSTFVQLRLEGELVSCAGTVEPTSSLLYDAGHNAYEAACRYAQRDPQGGLNEHPISVEVWLVQPLRPLSADSVEALEKQLNVGHDGVLLEYSQQHATLTPDKWSEFREPCEFLRQLWSKAGLPAGDWTDDMHVSAYTMEPLPAFDVTLTVSQSTTKPR